MRAMHAAVVLCLVVSVVAQKKMDPELQQLTQYEYKPFESNPSHPLIPFIANRWLEPVKTVPYEDAEEAVWQEGVFGGYYTRKDSATWRVRVKDTALPFFEGYGLFRMGKSSGWAGDESYVFHDCYRLMKGDENYDLMYSVRRASSDAPWPSVPDEEYKTTYKFPLPPELLFLGLGHRPQVCMYYPLITRFDRPLACRHIPKGSELFKDTQEDADEAEGQAASSAEQPEETKHSYVACLWGKSRHAKPPLQYALQGPRSPRDGDSKEPLYHKMEFVRKLTVALQFLERSPQLGFAMTLQPEQYPHRLEEFVVDRRGEGEGDKLRFPFYAAVRGEQERQSRIRDPFADGYRFKLPCPDKLDYKGETFPIEPTSAEGRREVAYLTALSGLHALELLCDTYASEDKFFSHKGVQVGIHDRSRRSVSFLDGILGLPRDEDPPADQVEKDQAVRAVLRGVADVQHTVSSYTADRQGPRFVDGSDRSKPLPFLFAPSQLAAWLAGDEVGAYKKLEGGGRCRLAEKLHAIQRLGKEKELTPLQVDAEVGAMRMLVALATNQCMVPKGAESETPTCVFVDKDGQSVMQALLHDVKGALGHIQLPYRRTTPYPDNEEYGKLPIIQMMMENVEPDMGDPRPEAERPPVTFDGHTRLHTPVRIEKGMGAGTKDGVQIGCVLVKPSAELVDKDNVHAHYKLVEGCLGSGETPEPGKQTERDRKRHTSEAQQSTLPPDPMH